MKFEYLVAEGVAGLFDQDLAFPWYRLASANGHQEAYEFLQDWNDEDYDDEEDEDEDDDESPSNAGAGFCTNCGTARSRAAKFCTNCGTAFEQPKIVATKKTDKPKNF